MSAFISSTIEDTQTAVTSLAFAVAGAASEEIGNRLVHYAGLKGTKGGLGDAGLSFIIRAAVSSAAFAIIAGVMPASAGNVLSTFVYFASNQSLINDARYIGAITIGGLKNTIPRGKAPMQPPAGGGHGGKVSGESDCSCKQ